MSRVVCVKVFSEVHVEKFGVLLKKFIHINTNTVRDKVSHEKNWAYKSYNDSDNLPNQVLIETAILI
ncbi:hypothetical protein TNIN_106861 [Trichonephila inaurata madagascariensis]|uniref:Uncharacterized protein n=1 Tax=Trichonephila inaurata madagascariensis TaxID=2747483 RepID=A0A8X6YSS1_9ARAC|nr:hypothetical protein TNIN_106861 [Trichonephila inaurata madagascariensis]